MNDSETANEGKICWSLPGGFSTSAMVESLVQPWHQASNMSGKISGLSKVKRHGYELSLYH